MSSCLTGCHFPRLNVAFSYKVVGRNPTKGIHGQRRIFLEYIQIILQKPLDAKIYSGYLKKIPLQLTFSIPQIQVYLEVCFWL